MNAHTYVASELRRGYAVCVSACTCASIAVVFVNVIVIVP